MSSSLQLEDAEGIYPHLSPFNSLHHVLSPNMRRTAYSSTHNPEECRLQLRWKCLPFSKPTHSLRKTLYKNLKNNRNSSRFSLPIRMYVCVHACMQVYTMCFPKIQDRKESPKMLKSQKEILQSSFFLNKPEKQSTKPSISFSKKT